MGTQGQRRRRRGGDPAGNVHLLTQHDPTVTSSLTHYAQTGSSWKASPIGAYPTPRFAEGAGGVPRLVYFDAGKERLIELRAP